MEMQDISKIVEDIFSDKNVVVITGAGVSVASGIRPFRGDGGIYEEDKTAPHMLSLSEFYFNPDEFYEFYKNNMMMDGYEPNIIHKTLARLEKLGLIKGIVTQNIDGLHQKAGSENVVELHGTGGSCFCSFCRTIHSMEDYKESDKCRKEGCKGTIRPNIVLYGEAPSSRNRRKAREMVSEADVVIVLGSSLTVGTVTGLIWNDFLNSDTLDKQLYIMNRDKTDMDRCAKVYHGDLVEAFEQINKALDVYAPEENHEAVSEEKAVQKVKTVDENKQ